MKTSFTSRANHAVLAALAGALALAAAACGEKPSQPSSQNARQAADAANSAIQRAAESAEQKLERAAEAVGTRLEGAGKALEDAAVTAKVKSALVAESNLTAMSIDVDTTAGVVTLKGSTENAEQKQRAEQLAAGVEGVRSVRNELVVIKG